MKWRILILVLLSSLGAGLILFFPDSQSSASPSIKEAVPVHVPRGVWVTVFSSQKVLYSQKAAEELIEFCVKNKIDDVYLQIYRSGKAYYDSRMAGADDYQKMVKSFGGDPIDFLLLKAGQAHINVHAWVNILSLAQNQKAPIIKKYGYDVLTADRSGRISIRTDGVDRSDKYYLRDDQIFLEPGDERVVDWSSRVVEEIIARYPSFNGIHFDYIRYPYPVPFIPDSRFTDFGVSYGYGKRNLERFREKTKLDPLTGDMYKNDLHLTWDNWKREQVTAIVERLSGIVRTTAKKWKVSCAVVPTVERAYLIAYQDWPLWLERGIVDHVVLMNYTKDERLAALSVTGALPYRGQGKIYTGLGLFLYKDQELIDRLYQTLSRLNADGVVFFSYDDLVGKVAP